MDWTSQTLQSAVMDVIDQMRRDLHDGRLVRADYDHNSEARKLAKIAGEPFPMAKSNKRVKIAGAILLGRWGDDSVTFDEAWEACVSILVGPRPE